MRSSGFLGLFIYLFIYLNSLSYSDVIPSHSLEMGCNIGYGFIWDNYRGAEFNTGFTHVTPVEVGNRNIRLIWGINVGTLKYLKEDWNDTENYAFDLNVFIGLRYLIIEGFSLETNVVWNPYICGCEEWKYHLFSSDTNSGGYNTSLLVIGGFDMKAKWKVWEGLFLGVGYSLRHNFAQSSWTGTANSFDNWGIDESTNANNTFRFLIGYSIDFGSKEKIKKLRKLL